MRLLTYTLCLLVSMSAGPSAAASAGTPDYAIIHYSRDAGDYGDHTTGDYSDFWGLHLWGDAIDPSEQTPWTAPRGFDGIDDYGAFFFVLLQDPSQPVNFIVHRGDQKDPDGSPDRSFDPLDTASIWLESGDLSVHPQRGAAEDFAMIHYHRDDGDYGDPTSPDFNDFWGLHVWTGAASPTSSWMDPLRPESPDVFGTRFRVDLVPGATELAYIIHRGDTKDPGPDQFLQIGTYGHEVWQLEDADPENPYILPLLRAQDAVEDLLAEEIEGLIDDGTLSWGRGNALLSKLDAAIKKLDQGKDAVAVNLLQAFIRQVSDFIDEGILTPTEGQPLIDAANEIISALGG